MIVSHHHLTLAYPSLAHLREGRLGGLQAGAIQEGWSGLHRHRRPLPHPRGGQTAHIRLTSSPRPLPTLSSRHFRPTGHHSPPLAAHSAGQPARLDRLRYGCWSHLPPAPSPPARRDREEGEGGRGVDDEFRQGRALRSSQNVADSPSSSRAGWIAVVMVMEMVMVVMI